MKNLEAYLATCEREAINRFSVLNNGPQLCGTVSKLVGIVRRLAVAPSCSHAACVVCESLRTIEAELAGETIRKPATVEVPVAYLKNLLRCYDDLTRFDRPLGFSELQRIVQAEDVFARTYKDTACMPGVEFYSEASASLR